jgi:light-regulated signal transduction histidine kinase (bacteriophytochrome)
VTLDNCDSEPIHVPGHIQPHGALLAFDAQRRLTHLSRNAAALLGTPLPDFGEMLAAHHFGGLDGLHQLIELSEADTDEAVPAATQVLLPGGSFELVVHRSQSRLVCEFERHLGSVPVPGDFGLAAQRAIDRLKRQTSVDQLLEVAVQAVRSLTGFDRVMAYRFRHDDSGDVVAESVVPTLEPFLGQRYPAGDIPQQARRLYTLNTLRLIGEVAATAVPVDALVHAVRDAPYVAAMSAGSAAMPGTSATSPSTLDMSYCVLRSVSPIHLEYLTNMGVAASMSVSIVIGGKLWGMLACHHNTPRRVAYPVRLACDMLAQVLSSHLQRALLAELALRSHGYANMRARLVKAVRGDADIALALYVEAAALTEAFAAQAVVVCQTGSAPGEHASADAARVHGGVPQAAAGALVAWLQRTHASQAATQDVVTLDTLVSAPEHVRDAMAGWAGVLALPFGEHPVNWLVLLRKEEVQNIHWGGKPEKVYKDGPSGPRLTPRGSFDLWKEIVRGKSVPWDQVERESAQTLFDDLLRADAIHSAERGKSRGQLLAMLGSDLRSPLQSILDTAIALRSNGADTRLGERLHATGERMQRLVREALETSRRMPGAVMLPQTRPTDLGVLLRALCAETGLVHPQTRLQPLIPRQLMVEVDAEQLAQAIRHLLFNAGQHGVEGEPVLVEMRAIADSVVIEISNEGAAISTATARQMFLPSHALAPGANAARRHMGVGLHVAHQIVQNHGGALTYTFADPYVVFSIVLPLRTVNVDLTISPEGQAPTHPQAG